MDKIEKLIVLAVISIYLIPFVAAAGDICDVSCELDPSCSDPENPYLCVRDWWPDKCVPQGYDFESCGSAPPGGGYCSECDEGCFFESGGCSGAEPWECRESLWPDTCVAEGYDFGCCGGVGGDGGEQTVITATITNNDPACTGTYPLEFSVRRKGETSFEDYSDECDEGDYTSNHVSIPVGDSMMFSCRDDSIPSENTGPHTARVSWCSASYEVEYGADIGCGSDPVDTPERTEWAKFIYVNQNDLVVCLYEKGSKKAEYPISSGRDATPTPQNPSYPDGDWVADIVPESTVDFGYDFGSGGDHYANYLTRLWANFYFHGPVYQQEEGTGEKIWGIFGNPSTYIGICRKTAGCIRLYELDAKAIYDWDPVGARYMITPSPTSSSC